MKADELKKILNEWSLTTFKEATWHIDADLSSFTTLRLKAQGHLVQLSNQHLLAALLKTLHQEKIFYQIIGWGANLIMPTDASMRLYIQLQKPKDSQELLFKQHQTELDVELSSPKDFYELSAATSLSELMNHARTFGNDGWQVLTGIPASLGGAIFMNAGTKFGDISSILKEVYYLTHQGEFKTHKVMDQSFSYRKQYFLKQGDVIIGAKLTQSGFHPERVKKEIKDYLEYRKKTQPMGEKNCGCVFKNPLGKSAGQLIEQAGLKGYQKGPVEVSAVHANFINNKGLATREEFLALTDYVKEIVFLKSGIQLEYEVQL